MRRNLGREPEPCKPARQTADSCSLHREPCVASMKVVVIAFGTRGDVQPLIVLTGGIASRSPWCSEVVLVSHHQHGDLAKSLLGIGGTSTDGSTDGSLATFASVDSPAVIWKGQ